MPENWNRKAVNARNYLARMTPEQKAEHLRKKREANALNRSRMSPEQRRELWRRYGKTYQDKIRKSYPVDPVNRETIYLIRRAMRDGDTKLEALLRQHAADNNMVIPEKLIPLRARVS